MESVWSTWSLSVTEVMRTDEPVMSNHWVKPSAGGALARPITRLEPTRAPASQLACVPAAQPPPR
jgi:hypothetical protein